jgi:hypothetical protein
MKNQTEQKRYAFDRPGNYRIRVQGYLDESWSDKLGMSVTSTGGKNRESVTTIAGPVADQAELSGILNTLYELHLTLLSVEYLGNG